MRVMTVEKLDERLYLLSVTGIDSCSYQMLDEQFEYSCNASIHIVFMYTNCYLTYT